MQAQVQADITTPGTANSFLRAAHVARTRRAHQVTDTLKHRAYDHYRLTCVEDEQHLLDFKQWCDERERVYIMQSIERFVMLLYDRTSTCADIDKARQKLFAKKTDVKQIPPTRAALK